MFSRYIRGVWRIFSRNIIAFTSDDSEWMRLGVHIKTHIFRIGRDRSNYGEARYSGASKVISGNRSLCSDSPVSGSLAAGSWELVGIPVLGIQLVAVAGCH